MIEEIVLYLIGFGLFVVFQALIINVWHESFTGQKLVDGITGKISYQGMIGYMIAPEWIEKNKKKIWLKPIIGCVKCESSVIGGVIFWGTILPLFGFHFIEIWIWVMDVFILVYLNYFFYKRV